MKSNHVMLYGYVGKDIVTKVMENGKKMVRISLATHSRFKNDKGEYIDRTCWHNVVAWDNTASIAERSFVKGSRILVEGSIVYLTYSNPTGKKNVTMIRADSLINLDR